MPDIGLIELVVIGLVLFLVVGPERMPELLSQVAGIIRKTRSWVNDAKGMVQEQAMELKDPLTQAREVVRGEIEGATDDVAGDVRRELRELKETGEVMKQRPLSEIYAEMQRNTAQDAKTTDDTSQGFMQGYTRPETAAQDAPATPAKAEKGIKDE